MAVLEDLCPREINEVIAAATDKAVPVTVTVRSHGKWANLHSRVIAREGHYLCITPPAVGTGHAAEDESSPAPAAPAAAAHEACAIAVGQVLGISLKLKHHKYVFQAVAVGARPGAAGPLLALEFPARMQRLQRRAYLRSDVPAGFIVRASFWLGDQASEPCGTSPDRPVWSGRIINLSAGGFLLRTTDNSVRSIEEGDLVGTRVLFGAGEEAIFADGQVRHIDPQPEHTVLGFQFIGMEQSEQGRDSLQAISQHTAEFQRIAYREELRQNALREAGKATG